MKTLNLNDIDLDNGLEVIETTSEGNGYPRNLKNAIIGFETYDAAKEMSEETGWKVAKFFKHDGWSLWARKGSAYEAMEITSDNFGDDYKQFGCEISEGEFFEDEVRPAIREASSMEELEKIAKDKRAILDEINCIDETQLVITRGGVYYDTVSKEAMRFSEDSQTWAIGLEEPDCCEEEDE